MDEQVFNEHKLNGASDVGPDLSPTVGDGAPSGSVASEASSSGRWQERQLEAFQVLYQGICTELAAELQQ